MRHVILVQMPVYKEGLEGVIMPTVTSLKAAISHYESHGGMFIRSARKPIDSILKN
jgi:hypothetical protein